MSSSTHRVLNSGLNEILWNRKYDHVFHIINAQVALQSLASHHEDELTINNGDYIATAAPYIKAIVEESLGKRVLEVDVKCGMVIERKPAMKSPLPGSAQLTFGLVLSKHHYKDTLERGPEANSAGAGKFRDFWGTDVQLRRFPDGNISESIVWKAETEHEKRVICARVVKLALSRHAAIDGKCVIYFGNMWDDTLKLQRVKLPSQWPKFSSTGEEYFSIVSKLYDTLSRDLRNIADLPLNIAAIRSVSPLLRSTEVFPPLPATFHSLQERNFIQPYIQSIPVQVVMEGSAKWPNDRRAICRLKTAFQLQLAEHLKGLEYYVTVPDVVRLEVWKNGYCFTVEVVYLGELLLSRKVTLPDGRAKLEDTPDFLLLKEKLDLQPKLSSAIAGVAGQDESFGTACRIAKRWIASQLLHGYIADEAVELLMAQVYVHPQPLDAPVAPDAAFLRFLGLIAAHDWQKNPLIVDFGKEMTHGEIAALKMEFTDNRKNYPLMTILTHFDRSSIWTKRSPSAVILKRICLLAGVSLKAAEMARLSPLPFDPKIIFRPPASDEWDCLIFLKENFVSRRHQVLDLLDELPVRAVEDSTRGSKKRKRNGKIGFPVLEFSGQVGDRPAFQGDGRILLNFDSVGEFVGLLRENYNQFAYFFVDPLGGSVVTVVWKTGQFKTLPFESDNLAGRMVENAGQNRVGKRKIEAKLCPNLTAMVEDFSLLGRGLVARVELRTEKWKI